MFFFSYNQVLLDLLGFSFWDKDWRYLFYIAFVDFLIPVHIFSAILNSSMYCHVFYASIKLDMYLLNVWTNSSSNLTLCKVAAWTPVAAPNVRFWFKSSMKMLFRPCLCTHMIVITLPAFLSSGDCLLVRALAGPALKGRPRPLLRLTHTYWHYILYKMIFHNSFWGM